jgi:hypothetical protein
MCLITKITVNTTINNGDDCVDPLRNSWVIFYSCKIPNKFTVLFCFRAGKSSFANRFMVHCQDQLPITCQYVSFDVIGNSIGNKHRYDSNNQQ